MRLQENKLLLSCGVGVMALATNCFAQDSPNVIIFLADDICYNDLETYGSPNTSTPNLTALAESGIKMNNCFQTSAMSSPTRHALYTGLYPVRSGAVPNHTFVYDNVKSFVQYFGENGYRTALYGKQHISPRKVFAYDYLGNYQNGKMNFKAIEKYLTSSESKKSPFFMVIASNEAHGPYNCGNPDKWTNEELILPEYFVDTPRTRTEYRKHIAEIEVMDKQVGEVRSMLKENGLEDNTIFVFLSEQGNSFPFAKWTCYAQGLKSGMLISYPDRLAKGIEMDALVEYVDVMPTLMELAGLEYQKKDFDGESMCRLLDEKVKEHKKRVYGLHSNTGVQNGSPLYGIRSVMDKKFHYIRNLLPEERYYNGIVGCPWWQEWEQKAKAGDVFAESQLHKYQWRECEELYDVENDPYELNNLAEDPKYRRVLRRMRKQLNAWMESQGDKGIQTEKESINRLVHWKR